MSDMPEWEHVIHRVEWVFMLGTMGDSEGRSWAQELIEERPFQTETQAKAYRDKHPDLELDRWGYWRAKSPYGMFRIQRREVRADAPPTLEQAMQCPEVAALVDEGTDK
jgi:hypothetical protein